MRSNIRYIYNLCMYVHMMRPCTLAAGSIRVASQMLAIEPLCSRHSPIYTGTQYSTLNDSLMNIYMLLHKHTFFFFLLLEAIHADGSLIDMDVACRYRMILPVRSAARTVGNQGGGDKMHYY